MTEGPNSNSCLLVVVEVARSQLRLVEKDDNEVRDRSLGYSSECLPQKQCKEGNNAKCILLGKVKLRKINAVLCI